MRCETFLDRFDSLEPGRGLPFRYSMHLSHCSSCQARIVEFESAIAAWRDEEALRYEDRQTLAFAEDRTMAAVRLMPRPRRELGMAQWMFPGFLVAISCIGLPIFAKFNGIGDEDLFFPLALVFGIALTVFGSVFASSHAVELKMELDKRLARASGAAR